MHSRIDDRWPERATETASRPAIQICEADTMARETFCHAPCLLIEPRALERLIEQGVLKPCDFRCADAASRTEVAAMVKRCAIRALAHGEVTKN